MTREELIAALLEEAARGGGEEGHMEADRLLLEFINDDEITQAFNSINKWYA